MIQLSFYFLFIFFQFILLLSITTTLELFFPRFIQIALDLLDSSLTPILTPFFLFFFSFLYLRPLQILVVVLLLLYLLENRLNIFDQPKFIIKLTFFIVFLLTFFVFFLICNISYIIDVQLTAFFNYITNIWLFYLFIFQLKILLLFYILL